MQEKWEVLRQTVSMQLKILQGLKNVEKPEKLFVISTLIEVHEGFLKHMTELDGWEQQWNQEKKSQE